MECGWNAVAEGAQGWPLLQCSTKQAVPATVYSAGERRHGTGTTCLTAGASQDCQEQVYHRVWISVKINISNKFMYPPFFTAGMFCVILAECFFLYIMLLFLCCGQKVWVSHHSPAQSRLGQNTKPCPALLYICHKGLLGPNLDFLQLICGCSEACEPMPVLYPRPGSGQRSSPTRPLWHYRCHLCSVVNTLQLALCSVHCLICTVKYALFSVQRVVCSVQCAVCSMQCVVRSM